jgi:hypothetical protein
VNREVREMEQKRGIPVVAEALGYVGGALALAAMAALLISFWAQIGIAGHVSIGLVLAVSGLGGGMILGRHEGEAIARLVHFLLAVGVAGVGFAVGFALYDTLVTYVSPGVSRSLAADWGYFAGACAIAIAAGFVWWGHRSILQHVVFGIGVAGSALLALPLIPIEGYEWGAGAVLVVVALVWGALALKDIVSPRRAGVALAALGIAGGIEMMAVSSEPLLVWPLWLGVTTCAVLVWAGSHLDDIVVLGIGTIALMIFAGQLVAEYLGFGAGTAIALVGIGFALLGACVRMTLRLTEETPKSRRVAGEVLGYLGIALAMGGAGILLQELWDDLGMAGRIAVPAVGAAVAYGSAMLLERSTTMTARRLGQTLLAIGVVSVGVTGAMVAQPLIDARFPDVGRGSVYVEIWTGFVGAVTGVVTGGITWRLRPGSLTQIAFVMAVVMLVMTGMNFATMDDSGGTATMAFGGLLLLLGTVWTFLGAVERITPPRTALALGGSVAFLGLQMLTRSGMGEFHTWVGILGVAYGVAFIVGSIYLKRAIMLGFGALYVIVYTMITVMEVFGGRVAAPILLLVTGVVFVVVAVVVAGLSSRMRRQRDGGRVTGAPQAH